MSSDYEMEGEERLWTTIVAGVAIGFVVGGVLAILFAPKPGAQMRADLNEAFDQVKDRAEKALDDLQEASALLVTRSKEVLEQTRENIVRSVEAGKEAYEQKKEELTAQFDA